MKITVKLFATLREGRFQIESLDFEQGVTVGRIIEKLNFPDHEVALMLVNGRHVEPDHVLREGDTLALFPPIGGGQGE